MAHKTPLVEGVFLVDPGSTTPRIVVGSPDWYRWLASASSFAVGGANGRYTARKDRRGPNDGYWRAYRKSQGKLASVYLGRSGELTLERLQRAAADLGLFVDDLNPASSLPADRAMLTGAAQGGILTFLLVDDGDTRPPRDSSAQLAGGAAQWTPIVTAAITAAGGECFNPAPATIGGAFSDVLDAIVAVTSAQRQLAVAVQAGQISHGPRMSLHTGVSARQHGTYIGHPVDWGIQLLASAHLGQVLLSHVTHTLIDQQFPADVTAADLGAYWVGTSRQPEHLFQLVVADVTRVRLPPRSPARRPNNLPAPATPLVGRERALAEAASCLRQDAVRLLTLTGPGGVGKTRLALQIAIMLRDHFADGVFFIDLASIVSPEFVVSTIAQALELSTEAGQTIEARLSDFLIPRQLLLVLDNFEQLLPAGVVLTTLLAAAPGLKLLVTSRAPLHLSSEHEFPVLPLETPDDLSDLETLARTGAVAVFTQRARAVNPGFALTRESAPVVVKICRRLDGLPLAIELAATSCKLFAPAVLLERLERRLPLLTSGASDLPARQRTLRDTIDWSYQLLNHEAQALLRRLAVFAGGVTLEAVEAICRGDDSAPLSATAGTLAIDVFPALEQLIDQSLLRSSADSAGSPRFTLLETIREYALERLERSGEEASARRHHASYFLRLAEQIGPELNGPDVRAGLERLASEHANIRAALSWVLARGEGELAARMVTAMLVYWSVRSHRREGRDWLEAALSSRGTMAPAVRAGALYVAGHLARSMYDLDAALPLLKESQAIFRALGDERAETAALTEAGWAMAMLGGDGDTAAAMLHNALVRYRALRDERGTAWALQALGWIELGRALGYPRAVMSPLNGLNWLARQRGSLAVARVLHAESLALRRRVADVHEIGWSLLSLGAIAAAEGEYDVAQIYQEERLAIERSLDNPHGLCSTLQQLGMIALRQGRLAVARTRLEESVVMARAIGDTNVLAFALIGAGELSLAEGVLERAEALFADAYATFEALGDEQRIARVYALLAQVALERGDDTTALAQIERCIRLARAIDDQALLSAGLAHLGDGAARRGEAAWAALLWGAAEGHSRTQLRVRAQPPGYERLFAETRAALGERAFAAAWDEGLGLEPEAALAARERKRSALPRSLTAEPARLTARESEVLALLAEGLSNGEIAERLVISPATVKTYLSTIYDKIGVRSRTAAVRYAGDRQRERRVV